MMPVIALVGRPNVGKSTLFNRILGQRKAIVEDYPGVTRDRNYAEVTRFSHPFTLIDTGGFEPLSQQRLLQQMREQSQLAIEEADLILFVLDVQQGLTPSDREVAQLLRQVDKPVLFVVNKVDGERQEQAAVDFYSLGNEQLHCVSAVHGLGVDELIEEALALLPTQSGTGRIDSEATRIAVIGRPNVGKSSLVNRLLGFERVVANPEAGTTRDSVDTPLSYNHKPYLLIDTAGIRRKGKVSQQLEKYSVVSAIRSLERAQVVLMVIDAVEGVTDQDLTIAGLAYEQGRAVLLVVNKWDAIAKDNATVGRYVDEIRRGFKFLPQAPIVFVSAQTGQRVARIMAEVEKLAEQMRRRVSTAELNRALEKAINDHPPAVFRGKRLKFFYGTQVGIEPPTFVLFVSRADGIHFSYERYLGNRLREAFDLKEVPIRLIFRNRSRD